MLPSHAPIDRFFSAPVNDDTAGDWTAYLERVYAGDSRVDPATLQLVYAHGLVHGAPSAAWNHSACFRFTGLGDRRCQTGHPAWATAYIEGRRRNVHRSEDIMLYNSFYNASQTGPAPWDVADHSWLEVTRWAARCAKLPSVRRGDGLVKGKGTGCWFFGARGSGVFVNVQRCLARESRLEVYYALLNRSKTRAFRHPRSFANWTDYARSVQSGEASYVADDDLCQAARSRGYDSILFRSDHYDQRFVWHESKRPRHQTELIICAGPCMHKPSADPCTRLELRTGARAQRPCRCDDQSAILNCGNLGRNRCSN